MERKVQGSSCWSLKLIWPLEFGPPLPGLLTTCRSTRQSLILSIFHARASTSLATDLPTDVPPCFSLTCGFSLFLYFISKTQAIAGPCFRGSADLCRPQWWQVVWYQQHLGTGLAAWGTCPGQGGSTLTCQTPFATLHCEKQQTCKCNNRSGFLFSHFINNE